MTFVEAVIYATDHGFDLLRWEEWDEHKENADIYISLECYPEGKPVWVGKGLLNGYSNGELLSQEFSPAFIYLLESKWYVVQDLESRDMTEEYYGNA